MIPEELNRELAVASPNSHSLWSGISSVRLKMLEVAVRAKSSEQLNRSRWGAARLAKEFWPTSGDLADKFNLVRPNLSASQFVS